MRTDDSPMPLAAREQSPEQRLVFLQAIQAMLLEGRLTMGQALRVLRAQHLGTTRKDFAKKVGLSYSALSHLESDSGNPTLASLEQAFRPFGFRIGVLPVAGSAVRVRGPELEPAAYQALAARILAVVDKRA